MAPDELAAAFVAAWSAHDPQAFEALCVADVHYEDPLTLEPLTGASAIGAHAARLWAGFPDARAQQTGASLSQDGFLAIPCKLLGTHTAALEGLPATGRFVISHCLFYCELRKEHLLRVRAFLDLYDAGGQLGVLPARGTLGEKALLMLRGFGLRGRD
jgi:SnoaL-like polyketide cyclase.